MLKTKTFTIAAVSEILSISPDTIRSWQRRGLMKSLSQVRPEGGWRRFTREDILRIGVAKDCAQGGISPVVIWGLLNTGGRIVSGVFPYAVGTSFRPLVYGKSFPSLDPTPEPGPANVDDNDICHWQLAYDDEPVRSIREDALRAGITIHNATPGVSEAVLRAASGGTVCTIHKIDLRRILEFLNARIDRWIEENNAEPTA